MTQSSEEKDGFEADEEEPRRAAWPAYACALFVLFAVVVEFLGGRGGPAIGARHNRSFYPATWDDTARVFWWLLVAIVAGTYRGLADWVDNRPVRWWLAALSAAPFVLFAIGIASSQG